MFDFNDKVEKIWSSMNDLLEEECILDIFNKIGDVRISLPLTIHDYYFIKICNEIVMVFTENRWLSTFVYENFSYNIEEKTITFKTKNNLYYKLKFVPHV